MGKLFNQKILKIFIVVVIFIIIAVLGYFIGGITKYYIDIQKADKSVERFQGSLEEPYKKDIYGGKTPEETWAMFLDALKKGDIELASKYFVVEKREIYQEELKNRSIAQLEKARKTWQKGNSESDNEEFYTYDVIIVPGEKIFDPLTNTFKKFPSGTYKNEIIFVQYPSGIWKIGIL